MEMSSVWIVFIALQILCKVIGIVLIVYSALWLGINWHNAQKK